VRAKSAAGVVAAVLAGAALAVPAAAVRHPLKRVVEKIEAEGDSFSISTDPRSGNAVIRYDDGGHTWRRVVHVPPNKLAVTVEAVVDEAPAGTLRYRYRLLSSPSSRQPARSFFVAMPSPVFEVTSPPSWSVSAFGYVSVLAWNLEGTNGGLAAGRRLGGFSFKAAAVPATRAISARHDGSRGGFVAGAGALPGIVACYVLGDAPATIYPVEPPDVPLPDIFDSGLAGRTVGPVEIPAAGTPAKLLDAMVGYAQASFELGWIERQATVRRYLAALSEVRQSLTPAPGAAAGRLRALAARADADLAKGAITTEACALFARNARYLAASLEAGSSAVRPPPEAPDAPAAELKASLTVDPKNIAAFYWYRLTVSPKSRSAAAGFVVDLSGVVFDVTSPVRWQPAPPPSGSAMGWSAAAGLGAGYAAGGFGFFALSESESSLRTVELVRTARGKPGFAPSRGSLPGIVDYQVVAAGGPPAPTPASSTGQAPVASLPPTATGKTIGPVAIPAEDDLATRLGTLLGYVKASRELGWIPRPETADWYLRSIEAARRDALEARKSREDIDRELWVLDHQIDLDGEQQKLSDQAFAILKLNCRWLWRWWEAQGKPPKKKG
jgi:hypothetical protein